MLPKIILERRNSDAALEGVNEEARAIAQDISSKFPKAKVPHTSKIKRYMKKT